MPRIDKDLVLLHADSEDSDQTVRDDQADTSLRWVQRSFCWFLSWGGPNICVFQVSSLKKTRYGQSALSFYFTGIFYIDIEDLTKLLMYYWIKPAWGKIRLPALPGSLSVFPNEFNKFNNTGARMQDSIYHTTLKSDFIYSYFCTKTSRFASLTRNVTK